MTSTPTFVLAVTGFQDSGKTTALCAVVERLVGRGLRIAVVKHDAHGITLDVEGKDSDRLFRAGADVWLRGPGEMMNRGRPAALEPLLTDLAREYDFILVEGHKRTALPKVWFEGADRADAPGDVTGVVATLPWGSGRVDELDRLVTARLASAWADRGCRGGVLVGGESRRMGRSKPALEVAGRPMAEIVAGALEAASLPVVELGGAFTGRSSLPDVVGVEGPLGGLLAGLRWVPDSAWVMAACDLPALRAEAVEWLLGERQPGRWAIVPRLPDGRLQPLLAVYEPQCHGLLESLVGTGAGPAAIATHPSVWSPQPPDDLVRAWTNVNTPEDLRRFGVDGL